MRIENEIEISLKHHQTASKYLTQDSEAVVSCTDAELSFFSISTFNLQKLIKNPNAIIQQIFDFKWQDRMHHSVSQQFESNGCLGNLYIGCFLGFNDHDGIGNASVLCSKGYHTFKRKLAAVGTDVPSCIHELHHQAQNPQRWNQKAATSSCQTDFSSLTETWCHPDYCLKYWHWC